MSDFSFIVPVYKVPLSLLRQCIDSILGQTHKNIELILVDDGSPDDCGKVCDEYAKEDSRVHVIHKPNGGLSDARNAGTDIATSPWITYVDGDDWVELDFAELFLKRISGNSNIADIYIYAGCRNYANRIINPTPYFSNGTIFATKKEREELQKECCKVFTKDSHQGLFIGSACGKVYRHSFLLENQLKFTIVPYGEDSIFYFHSIEKANLIEYVYQIVYHYRDTEGSMVNKYRKQADVEQNIYLHELFRFAKEYQKSNSFIDCLYYRVMVSMQRIIEQKFFNPQNPNSILKKQRECSTCFSHKPYSDVFKHISFRVLNRNGKIKYIILRLKLYCFVEYFRTIYLKYKRTVNVNRNYKDG